jgi:hypothetical protein
MDGMDLQYNDKTGTGKRGDIGCIEWLVHHSRGEIIKLINATALSTHRKRITITRDKGIINSSNRFKKRVKGAFYLDFVKGGVDDANSEDDNKVKVTKKKAKNATSKERELKELCILTLFTLMSHTVSLKFLQGLREWSLPTAVMRTMMMTVVTN